MRKYIGEIALLLTSLIWGSGFVASAVSLDYFTPYQILVARFLLGTILLSVIYLRRLINITYKTLLRGGIIGFFLYSAFALQTIGLQFTTPSKNAFLTAVNVVIVPFIVFIFNRRKVDNYEVVGAITALIGVGVISLEATLHINIGDLLTLCCAVAFALHIYFTSRYIQDEDPILLTLVQLFTAFLIGAIVLLFRNEVDISFVDKKGVISLLHLGIFSTAIAFLLQTFAQKFVSETNTAIILSTEAVWGMIFSVILLSEILNWQMITGAVLILSAIIISDTKLSFIKRAS